MKSLSTLIKLQKTRVDEQRLLLARLQEKLDLIERSILGLESEKLREQAAVQKEPERAITYGEFLRQAIKRGRALEREREVVAVAVNAAHEMLIELYEEQKRYEIAEAARIAAEEREELKRETLELDEIGGVTHERRKAE